MRPRPLLTRCIFAAILGGCGADDAGPDPDRNDDGSAGCELPEYGDGTCNTDLACDEPDIDCFRTFATDAEAQEWFAVFETKLAEEEGREPRAVIPETDPRVPRMRELLDRGWDAYQATNPVGDLAEHRPSLVVVEDASINAFVIPDLETDTAGFAVMVHTGLLDQDSSDAAMLGLVMHELEHAVGLHIVADVRDRMRKFYVADYGEPFGFQQDDDPVAREHGELWRAAAAEAGAFPHADLRGLPMGAGQLDLVFNRLVAKSVESDACIAAIAAFDQLKADIAPGLSPLDGSLALPPDTATRADAAMAGMRDGCLPSVTQSFIEIVAEIAGTTPEMIEESLTAEDKALIADKHALDAIAVLLIDRRSTMRGAEEAFQAATGLPWSTLRYFSTEEAADDATIPVLAAGDLPADGLGEFLLAVFDDAGREACLAVLETGDTPPYGADLDDEHHSTCWRVDHVRKLAESGVLTGDDEPDGYGPSYRRIQPRSRKLPIPPRLGDVILY